MAQSEKTRLLKQMLSQVAGSDGMESLREMSAAAMAMGAFESVGADEHVGRLTVQRAVEKLERGAELSSEEIFGLEAIVLPAKRPVVFIIDDDYQPVPLDDWRHLNQPTVHARLSPQFPSIGRVEVPLLMQVPYGGTGFVVGENLLMTNRHVAQLFTKGLGTHLVYTPGGSAIDFKREEGATHDASSRITVTSVVMIHPYWDMALVRVGELPPSAKPLPLSTRPPEAYEDQDVVVVGYPARDPRNALDVQDAIFGSKYGVKRMQPGKIRLRESIQSFETRVNALTHDSSTLGGNSGSAVLDVKTGMVVGLHFAGTYLRANYAVPMSELARDARVVNAGLNFQGTTAAWSGYDAAWSRVNSEKVAPGDGSKVTITSGQGNSIASVQIGAPGSTASFVIPLHVSISIGTPVLAGGTTDSVTAPPPVQSGTEKVPYVYPNIELRKGYAATFLKFSDNTGVPLPQLTSAGKAAAARLADGTYELKYHHFSVVMQKERRLALFTAANVDWRREKREIDGQKPSRKRLNGFTGNEQEDWLNDERLSPEYQLPDYFYSKDRGAFDRGHLVRRDDVAWGNSFEEMQKGNGDTFHMTNCSPQVAGFNQAKFGNFNWGQLENMIQKETNSEKVCVFSGPVLDPDDDYFHGLVRSGVEVSVQIPRSFWKIIVAKQDGSPAAFGFILDQDLSAVDLYEELIIPDAWRDYLRPISEIESLMFGLAKLTWFKKWDRA